MYTGPWVPDHLPSVPGLPSDPWSGRCYGDDDGCDAGSLCYWHLSAALGSVLTRRRYASHRYVFASPSCFDQDASLSLRFSCSLFSCLLTGCVLRERECWYDSVDTQRCWQLIRRQDNVATDGEDEEEKKMGGESSSITTTTTTVRVVLSAHRYHRLYLSSSS